MYIEQYVTETKQSKIFKILNENIRLNIFEIHYLNNIQACTRYIILGQCDREAKLTSSERTEFSSISRAAGDH